MISAVILTKNEEEKIITCLENLLFCDEIIIIDDFSTDRTIKEIRNFQKKIKGNNLEIKIYQRHLKNNFAQQRNFGLKKTNNNWVFFVDADEIVSDNLKKEINKTLTKKELNFNGFLIRREDIFLNKKLRFGETGNIKLLRLGKKDFGFWIRPVHEVWKIKGEIGILKNQLLHKPHRDIKEFVKKINYYSTVNANYLLSINARNSMKDVILYPTIKFILNFILKKGFLDGTEGLIHSLMMSFHSFLTRAKLYLYKHAKRK